MTNFDQSVGVEIFCEYFRIKVMQKYSTVYIKNNMKGLVGGPLLVGGPGPLGPP